MKRCLKSGEKPVAPLLPGRILPESTGAIPIPTTERVMWNGAARGHPGRKLWTDSRAVTQVPPAGPEAVQEEGRENGQQTYRTLLLFGRNSDMHFSILCGPIRPHTSRASQEDLLASPDFWPRGAGTAQEEGAWKPLWELNRQHQ